MLKLLLAQLSRKVEEQPPSGGCVLKQGERGERGEDGAAAAFGRLCVETWRQPEHGRQVGPAAFGRLCVETPSAAKLPSAGNQPPSGGCVLKLLILRLPACLKRQPPSGGCVLKPV